MKSFILMVIAMVCVVSLEAQNKSFYDFTVRTIDGKEFPLSSLKGKKVLVVNVASKCGLTPQYAKLQELYEKYKDMQSYKSYTISIKTMALLSSAFLPITLWGRNREVMRKLPSSVH